ncbi:MAG: hypothetical protein WAM53_03270 [Terrimicrobiaceae bacterium]
MNLFDGFPDEATAQRLWDNLDYRQTWAWHVPVVMLAPRRVFPHAMILVIFGASAFRLQCILSGASEFSRWFLLPGSLGCLARH